MKLAWIVALLAAGCSKPLTCTAEVTEGSGSFRASQPAADGETEIALRRRVVGLACADLCAVRSGGAGCTARCAVDVDAGKIGARVQCGR